MWALHECVLRQFSVSPRMYTPIFARQITKNYKMFSMWLQNKDKAKTHNALCNFSKSPHMCKLPGYMAWCIMPYIHCLRSALVSIARQAFYTNLACLGFLRRHSESERGKCV